ncbi:membrane protein, putative [Babesia bigemina]|uniref:Membrane protein, putative n=1 Tax=Babesia bigemina TaxID=5866 RepID=A0A061DBZ8_BABBI|nr:membrane protein, putative [Babesia bigemina]CDR95280.1 membrane protein, putative [Babesia bigemina]|eukprot:XP_012767466.1 membrane protein, putative [Babesia bigemina]
MVGTLWLCAALCSSLCIGLAFEGCDVVVDSSICIKDGATVLLPSARRDGRVLHYRFDEEVAVDSSGFGNHGVGPVAGHSGFSGVGSSAYFRKNFVYLPDTKSLRSNEFSVALFVFFLKDEESAASADKVNDYCPLVHKGIRTAALSECAPEIAVNPKDGRVRVLLSVESSQTMEVESNCRLQPHQWYHIAVVKDKSSLTLYINAYVRYNPLPLYVGASPYMGKCDMPVLIDELSFYTKALGRDEVQAEASAVLGGVEPSYVAIGCINCGKEEAMKSCPQGYHLCNKFELYTGMYKTTLWFMPVSGGYGAALRLSIPANRIMAAASAEPSTGVALCCANLQN